MTTRGPSGGSIFDTYPQPIAAITSLSKVKRADPTAL